jgi:crotonobetainyl-CoA:carnitine CoA-transferase CaiB-like acyl-CoA transferase
MDERIAAWAASGAMALTGRPNGPPLGPPEPLVERLTALGAGFAIDPLQLLGERAAIAGFGRRGDISCGGSTRFVRASDGWLAVTLARDDDIAAVPAWLETTGPDDTDGLWRAIAAAAAGRPTEWLAARATLLGLPIAVLPSEPTRVRGAQPFDSLPVRASAFGPSSRRPTDPAVVIDLSSLWAGPLCGHLMLGDGVRVIKVESTERPDGARRGPTAFFDLLNGGKQSVALALSTPEGLGALRRLIAASDVVIEASRPRALAQLGIFAAHELRAETGPAVWVSITGHGRDGSEADRVAFGDDAAVAGGLVVFDADGPCFCADAIADPITGLVAASAIRVALHSGQRWLLDIAMARVAADLAGPTLDASALAATAAPPAARHPSERAAPLGRDTLAVLGALA